MPPIVDATFEKHGITEVLAANLFDGDVGYNMGGFGDHITVDNFFVAISLYSVFNFPSVCQDLPSQSIRNNQYWQSELLLSLHHAISMLFE